jgi:hypothetical protein
MTTVTAGNASGVNDAAEGKASPPSSDGCNRAGVFERM